MEMILILAVIAISGLLFFLLGPRIDLSGRMRDVELPHPLAAMDEFLAAEEAKYPILMPGMAKGIAWFRGKREKTRLALIYIHGFSASRQEISPVMERLGEHIGANVFFTRLKGHGVGPDGFKGLKVSDWIDDLSEALAVGRQIGESNIVVATSTGAALAVWAASMGAGIDCLVLVSPNFQPSDKRASIICWPWGRIWVRLFLGNYGESTPGSELEASYWTWRQHTDGLFAMMGAVLLARKADLSKVTVPTLVLYTKKDEVVSVPAIKRAFERLGSTIKELYDVREACQHVLAGAATCPGAVDEVERPIALFLSACFKDASAR